MGWTSDTQIKLSGSRFPGSVSTIMVESSLPEEKGYTSAEISLLLRQRHRISTGADGDFAVRDLSALSETLKLTSSILSVQLGSIAFISLLVGGIGIMNIMLVNVTERNPEIGLRMALGASRSSVLGQLLIESILLSLTGAVAGLALGICSGWLIARTGALTPEFTATSVELALGVAVGVGVIFGIWPARRAAALEPVEALRTQ